MDPAARHRLLALLRADGLGAWEQPAHDWQSIANATFRRAPGGTSPQDTEERVCVTLATTEPSLDVVADLLYYLPVAAPLLPAQVVDIWTRLARRCTSQVASSITTLTAGSARGLALELHLEAVGAPGEQLGAALDLTGLGVPDLSQLASTAAAWPWAAFTPGAERLLALEALRTACLNWGSIDPDQALRAMGWTA